MRNSYIIEITSFLLVMIIGGLTSRTNKWYFDVILFFIGFGLYSFFIGQLKKETLKEYQEALTKSKEENK